MLDHLTASLVAMGRDPAFKEGWARARAPLKPRVEGLGRRWWRWGVIRH
jgi:hypothetical protein